MREHELLDFKGGRYQGDSGAPWSVGCEFAKDVAALANHRGGVLMLGVTEEEGCASELRPIADSSAEAEERRMRQWLARYLAPTLDVTIRHVDSSDGGFFLLVGIPRSPRRPHAVQMDGGRKPLVYPIRDGAETAFLSEHDVARLYAERIEGAAERRDRLELLVARGLRMLERATGTWVWLAMTAELPSTRLLDGPRVSEIDSWAAQVYADGPMGGRICTAGPIVGPGCVTYTSAPFTDGEDPSEPRDSYLELHSDGSSFVAADVSTRTGTRGVGERTLVDSLIPAIEITARWAVETAGPGGSAVVATGLADTDADGSPLQLIEHVSGDRWRQVRSTRPLIGAEPGPGILLSRDNVVADLNHCAQPSGRLALTHSCASRLLQQFGRAEPEGLTGAGEVVALAWHTHPNDVQRWADNHDYPCVLHKSDSSASP